MTNEMGYNGEFKYINLGPEKVKAMYNSDDENIDREKIEIAYSFWKMKGGYASDYTKAGYIDKGDDRDMKKVDSMKDLVNSESREPYIFSRTLVTPTEEGGSILDDIVEGLR